MNSNAFTILTKNIEAVYKRKSEILYPPFDVSYFRSLMKKIENPPLLYPRPISCLWET